MDSKNNFISNPREAALRAYIYDKWLKRTPWSDLDLSSQIDNPMVHYDYRTAIQNQVEPQMYYDAVPHWSSDYKDPWHKTYWMNGYSTATGEPLIRQLALLRAFQR